MEGSTDLHELSSDLHTFALALIPPDPLTDTQINKMQFFYERDLKKISLNRGRGTLHEWIMLLPKDMGC